MDAGPLAGSVRSISSVEALDQAFAGGTCELVRADGRAKPIAVGRWSRTATSDDHELFVEPCQGPTLDVGCGPGRLTVALLEHGLEALGLDISQEAVRRARARGAEAVCADVFSYRPRAVGWHHVLLADGNIGLGGDPVHLLRRVKALLASGGSVLVELARPGVGLVREQARLRVGEQLSQTFLWATVGVDVVAEIAAEAALSVAGVRWVAGRYVATLTSEPGTTTSGPDLRAAEQMVPTSTVRLHVVPPLRDHG